MFSFLFSFKYFCCIFTTTTTI